MLPWKTTIDSRLRWMQFRINHFILPTNKWLHRIGLVDSPICKRCNTHIETMDHMIVECPKVNEFWLEFVCFIICPGMKNYLVFWRWSLMTGKWRTSFSWLPGDIFARVSIGNLHCRSVFSNSFWRTPLDWRRFLQGRRIRWSFIFKNGLILISNISISTWVVFFNTLCLSSCFWHIVYFVV